MLFCLTFFPVKKLIIVLLSLMVCGVAGFSGWLLLHEDRHTIVAEVPADYLETADTSRFSTYPVDLARFSAKDSVLLIFPSGENGGNVSVLVYDSLQYALLMDGERSAKPMEKATLLGKLRQEPLVNFSGIPDGSYYARLSSCNYGGFIHVKLRTVARAAAVSGN